jgi:hypothetical protein
MRYLHLMIIGVAALGLVARDARAACDDAAAVAATRTAAEAACALEGNGCATAASHGKYVSCIAQQTNLAVQNGTLPKSCKGAVKKCAAKSTCGKPGFVTCCRTKPKSDGSSVTKCSIKKSAESCRPPKNGTACAGAQSSCCDACPDGVCESPSGAFLD